MLLGKKYLVTQRFFPTSSFTCFFLNFEGRDRDPVLSCVKEGNTPVTHSLLTHLPLLQVVPAAMVYKGFGSDLLSIIRLQQPLSHSPTLGPGYCTLASRKCAELSEAGVGPIRLSPSLSHLAMQVERQAQHLLL